MADNFNLTGFLKKNQLLNENIGGYVDLKPVKEEMGTAMGEEDSMTADRGWEYDDAEAEENEYSFMDNDELVGILQKIHDVYSNPEFTNIDTEGVTTHLKQAISLLNARTGN